MNYEQILIKYSLKNLIKANLSRANLSEADLSRVNLSGADLSVAYLSGANLSGAYLFRANLFRANLFRANLSGAYLSGAYLFRANLSGADLSGADLSGANLSGADLSGAYLFRADLSRANLSGANLSGANLSRADLSGAILPNFKIAPETGSFIGYKKVYTNNKKSVLIMLQIPASAERVTSLTGRKLRASKAKVIKIFNEDKILYSNHDPNFIYKLNKIVKPKEPFNDDIRTECASGIHFFITKKEAEEY